MWYLVYFVVYIFVQCFIYFFFFFFSNDTATTEIYTLSLHDALPILFADDPEGDAPHRDPEDEVPVAAAPYPANTRQPDARGDREQQHQAVHVEDDRPEVERAVRRGGDAQKHRRDASPTGRAALRLSSLVAR